MVPKGHWNNTAIKNFWIEYKEELCLADIKPAEYKVTNVADIIKGQTHLSKPERKQLEHALADFQPLFQGKRGNYKGEPITLELIPGSKPFYGKPFPIPKAYQQVTKDEITRLENIGLFTKVNKTEWAVPTFIIPKKNQTVRVITDF